MILLSTGSIYNYGTARAFELAAQAGYDGMEVLVDDRWDTSQPAYLRRLSSEYGLPIMVVHSPFLPHIPDWPDSQLSRLQRSVTLAQELGAQMVVTHLPLKIHAISVQWYGRRSRRWMLPLPIPRRGPYYQFLKNGSSLAALEAESGITIGVENMPAKRMGKMALNPYWFNVLSEMARFPHVTLDTTHLGTWGLNPVAAYDLLHERIVHVHLSNFNGQEHRLLTDGHLPLADLLRRMAIEGYTGTITVELDPHAWDVSDENRCLDGLRQALVFCRVHYRAHSDESDEGECGV
ncbi:MAG TPA: sugar phosphate isomerase/epimerase [Chloroflexi bacterium]|nr:sugar phosphate isomerase/epimerase [Chloroflexota bacterium]